jgi:dTDP-4-amino-4,6-dideoxygalactose transaminase
MRALPPVAAPLEARELRDALAAVLVGCSHRPAVEQDLREFLGVRHVFLFSSGRAALTVLLQAMSGLRTGRAVLLPAYTCYSVPAAIIRAGLTPVLVDLDPATLAFDGDSLRQALARPGVMCVLPTHLFGLASDVDLVRRLCGDDVFVVEDAAQALGVPGSRQRPLGSIGDAGLFSLGRGKHLTCGTGGVVSVRDTALADRVAERHVRLRRPNRLQDAASWMALAAASILIKPRLYRLPSALPFLGLGRTVYSTAFPVTDVSNVAVGALRSWRERLERANGARRAVVEGLRREVGITVTGSDGPLLRYPVLMPSAEARNRFIAEGSRCGLGISPMYPAAIHQIPALRGHFEGQRFPGAEAIASRLATVPTHEFVGTADVAAIARAYRESLRRVGSTAPVPVRTAW